MFFSLGSIAGAGLAALGTFKNTLMSGGQQAPLNVHINIKLSSENVTIVSPQPLEVIGPQFDFKFVDTAYNLTGVNNGTSAPLAVTLRNSTFEVALYPSKIHFIPDSDPPMAEANILVFTHPGLAEGPYNLSISEWVWGEFNMPTGFSHFDVPVEFSFAPKAPEDAAAHDEL